MAYFRCIFRVQPIRHQICVSSFGCSQSGIKFASHLSPSGSVGVGPSPYWTGPIFYRFVNGLRQPCALHKTQEPLRSVQYSTVLYGVLTVRRPRAFGPCCHPPAPPLPTEYFFHPPPTVMSVCLPQSSRKLPLLRSPSLEPGVK